MFVLPFQTLAFIDVVMLVYVRFNEVYTNKDILTHTLEHTTKQTQICKDTPAHEHTATNTHNFAEFSLFRNQAYS